MPAPPASSNPYAPPSSRVGDPAPQDAAPALWNPNAAANWSLLCSPVFGALLHMKNWEALGEPGKAAASKAWAMVSAAFFIGVTGLGVWMPTSPDVMALSRSGGVALLIAWYFASARPQARLVKERFGTAYPRKGWGRPFLLFVLGLAGFIVVAMVVAFAALAIKGAP